MLFRPSRAYRRQLDWPSPSLGLTSIIRIVFTSQAFSARGVNAFQAARESMQSLQCASFRFSIFMMLLARVPAHFGGLIWPTPKLLILW